MTHARSRNQNPAADLGVRLDPEEIRHLRRFADRALLPSSARATNAAAPKAAAAR